MTNPDRAHGFRRRKVTIERHPNPDYWWRIAAERESRVLYDTCGGSKGSTVHVLPGPMARYLTWRETGTAGWKDGTS